MPKNLIFHYFGFHCVICSKPLDLPCACGTFNDPMLSIGSIGSLVQIMHFKIFLVICQVISYWKDNLNIPILEEGIKERYSPSQVINTILTNGNDIVLCTSVPLQVRTNASFLIDSSTLKRWQDIKCDLNGSYDKVVKSRTITIQVTKLEDQSYDHDIIAQKEVSIKGENSYHFYTNAVRNKAEPALVRAIFFLGDDKGQIVNNIIVLQYYIVTGEDSVSFTVKSHGNSKKVQKPFYPTSASTMDEMKSRSSVQSSRRVFGDMLEETGGVTVVGNPSMVPRSTRQLYDINQSKLKKQDPVEDLLLYVKHHKDEIAIRHVDLPCDTWVVATPAMCQDVVRFSTSELLSMPLSIDPTFEIGEFEVTPIVYHNLLLKNIKTGAFPIQLGPTMIHHRKDYDTYKSMSSACVARCKGLEKARAIVTDGEEMLINAWKSECRDAVMLRDFRHFRTNCSDKLHSIGIRANADKKYFLNKLFGLEGKEAGVFESEHKKELKKNLRDLQKDFDNKEREILGKDQNYQPQFSSYIVDHYDMIKSSMIAKARRKAGLPEESGRPVRCFSNPSESMNHVIKVEKHTRFPNKRFISKLEFLRDIFEHIHARQQEEVARAIGGMSDLVQLSPLAEHLRIDTDVWFEWNKSQRGTYLEDFNKLSIEEAFSGKEISWPELQDVSEFVEPAIDIKEFLIHQMNYEERIAEAVKANIESLLNNPRAICRVPTLNPTSKVKFFVASNTAKDGRVECAVHKDHVSCTCGLYKHDNICKHSIAVAHTENIMEKHLKFLVKVGKKPKKSPIAEDAVNRKTAGKKGGKNKFPYRPATVHSAQSEPKQPYTAIYHNDNVFTCKPLHEQADFCRSCNISFCHRQRILPYNLIFEHKEKWYYPVKGDWSNKRESKYETTRYYHVSKDCIMKRFPYFTTDYIDIPNDVKLEDSHKELLFLEFGYTFDPASDSE